MFIDLDINKQVLKALDKLGYSEPTEVQRRSIPEILAGRDVLASAKTGSGKTAAFFIPVLNALLERPAPNTGTRVLVLLPTRELALQTQKTFTSLATFTSVKSGLIIGGEAFKHQVATLRRNPEVVIATPGRLVEHIEKGTPDFKDLEFLILDEADRMLDMGFALDMNTIGRACNEGRQSLLFSATLRHKGITSIKGLLREPVSIAVDDHRQAHSHITQQMVLADDVKHKEKLVAAIIEQEQARLLSQLPQDSTRPLKTMVFCNTRAQCQQLGNVLAYKKLKAAYIHGEVSQNDRKQIMNRFRQGAADVLVATDVAARGLDIPGIDLIINFTVAQSGDDHVHRIGRTGRAGQSGIAVTLVGASEWNQMSSIERYLKTRFEPRKLEGLIASYKGPKKLKKSGKAAGSKKKKTKAAGLKKKASTAKSKTKQRSGKTAAQRRKETGDKTVSGSDQGFDALRKKT